MVHRQRTEIVTDRLWNGILPEIYRQVSNTYITTRYYALMGKSQMGRPPSQAAQRNAHWYTKVAVIWVKGDESDVSSIHYYGSSSCCSSTKFTVFVFGGNLSVPERQDRRVDSHDGDTRKGEGRCLDYFGVVHCSRVDYVFGGYRWSWTILAVGLWRWYWWYA